MFLENNQNRNILEYTFEARLVLIRNAKNLSLFLLFIAFYANHRHIYYTQKHKILSLKINALQAIENERVNKPQMHFYIFLK